MVENQIGKRFLEENRIIREKGSFFCLRERIERVLVRKIIVQRGNANA
jgi:hypothetical protein